MTVRAVEWKLPYTWGVAIDIDENKVISLRLRDENNLIIWDQWDNEIYVDLQLNNELRPTSAFPVWVTTGRVIVDNGWDVTGTIICAKTTSGDNIKLLYGDNWKLYIDNWTGTFKQIYLKGDVDALLQALRDYVDTELAKKQDLLTAWDNITIAQDGTDLVISADVNTKAFYVENDQDLTTAQEVLDWYNAGNNPIVIYNNTAYVLTPSEAYPSSLAFASAKMFYMRTDSDTGSWIEYFLISYSWDNVTWISISGTTISFIETDRNYSIPYIPPYDWSPATKIYVDSNVLARVDSSEPSNPLTWQLWYDTANSVLKVHDGTAWQTV